MAYLELLVSSEVHPFERYSRVACCDMEGLGRRMTLAENVVITLPLTRLTGDMRSNGQAVGSMRVRCRSARSLDRTRGMFRTLFRSNSPGRDETDVSPMGNPQSHDDRPTEPLKRSLPREQHYMPRRQDQL